MGSFRGMGAPAVLSVEDLARIREPTALLEHAWAIEPWLRFAERTAVLDAIESLLDADDLTEEPPGRSWRLEMLAERSIDLARTRRIEEACATADQVIDSAEPEHEIAIARALLGRGQALAWVGTDEATRQSSVAFEEAAGRFAALGNRDWQGSALLRWGYSACYQYGDLVGAQALIRQACETYPPDSMRLPGALSNYADVLIDLGELDTAEEVLNRAEAAGQRDGVLQAISIAWPRAHIAAGRGDARATERLMREAERTVSALDWFETHTGMSFLLDAAELLDRVGLHDQAWGYYERALERGGEDDEEVMQTTAVLRARSGDPERALEELQQLARVNWLEKRLVWRHTCLTAWATFRAGRGGAGELAALALGQAVACGGVRVARAGEAGIVAALAPLAEATGSAPARELLLGERQLMVRLFGTPRVVAADGSPIAVPPGMPGELIRLLALHEHGLPVDVVLDQFFPEVSPPAARQRLRQVLTRLRTAAGDVVVRDGETLKLVPAWVDAREFLEIGKMVRGARGGRALQLAYAALALHSGPFLATDPYAAWAEEARHQIRYRHLALLDYVADDAVARDSYQEALTALETALEEDPGDDDRRAKASELQALARRRTRALGH